MQSSLSQAEKRAQKLKDDIRLAASLYRHGPSCLWRQLTCESQTNATTDHEMAVSISWLSHYSWWGLVLTKTHHGLYIGLLIHCWLQAEFDTVLEMFSFRRRAEEVSRDSQVIRLRKELEEARGRTERVERVSGRLFTVVVALWMRTRIVMIKVLLSLLQEFSAYKKHSSELLRQERELNAKLRHLLEWSNMLSHCTSCLDPLPNQQKEGHGSVVHRVECSWLGCEGGYIYTHHNLIWKKSTVISPLSPQGAQELVIEMLSPNLHLGYLEEEKLNLLRFYLDKYLDSWFSLVFLPGLCVKRLV